MILTIILSIIFLILAVFVVLTLCVGGAGFIIVFGDVIVCILFIAWIIKKIFRKKK